MKACHLMAAKTDQGYCGQIEEPIYVVYTRFFFPLSFCKTPGNRNDTVIEKAIIQKVLSEVIAKFYNKIKTRRLQ